jgi:hypothetical protein
MIRFLLVSVTGWVAVLGTGIEIALPYRFRNIVRTNAGPAIAPAPPAGLPVGSTSLRLRMWPHYYLGYALLALVLTHTSLVMGPAMERTDATGIWAATLALGVLLLQVALGLTLKGRTGNRVQLRRWHFWSMLGFLALVSTHLWRNGK